MEKWQIYVAEARSQIRFARYAYDEFEGARQDNDVERIFYHLHHFIAHIVNLDKVVSFKPGSQREQVLKGKMDLTGIDLKQIWRMRNHLEHYDERLDDWIANFYGGPFFDMNITTGAVGFPYHAALRSLDGHNLRFQGETYDLSQLYTQLVKLDERLHALDMSS